MCAGGSHWAAAHQAFRRHVVHDNDSGHFTEKSWLAPACTLGSHSQTKTRQTDMGIDVFSLLRLALPCLSFFLLLSISGRLNFPLFFPFLFFSSFPFYGCFSVSNFLRFFFSFSWSFGLDCELALGLFLCFVFLFSLFFFPTKHSPSW